MAAHDYAAAATTDDDDDDNFHGADHGWLCWILIFLESISDNVDVGNDVDDDQWWSWW